MKIHTSATIFQQNIKKIQHLKINDKQTSSFLIKKYKGRNEIKLNIMYEGQGLRWFY